MHKNSKQNKTKMSITMNMDRFLILLYIICLVHTQVPRNCVNSKIVSDLNSDSYSGGSYLAKDLNSETLSENHHQQLLQQHRLHHKTHQKQNHYSNQRHETHNHHNGHHHNHDGSHHHVDAGNHNDVEIGHTQPNMVNYLQNRNWKNRAKQQLR